MAILLKLPMRRIVSPSAALMFSSLARAGSHLLPVLVMYAFGMKAEAAFWLLLAGIIGLQNLLFLGVPQVLIRMLSFSAARSGKVEFASPAGLEVDAGGLEEWVPLPDLVQLMRQLFLLACVAVTLAITVGGSFAVANVIAQTDHPHENWIAWMIMVALSPIRILMLRHLTFLHGMGRIAKPRFIDGAGWTASGLIAAFTFALDRSLATMALASYLPVFVAFAMLHREATSTGWKTYIASARSEHFGRAFHAVWHPAWRAGLGQALSLGARQGTGIILAQYVAAPDAAGFLMAMNVSAVVMMLGAAPFQAALPSMSKAYALGNTAEHCRIAQMTLSRSLWLVALACGGIGLAIIPILRAVGAEDTFVSPSVWLLISLTLFAQRYGAVHLQHYSITNHIFWHWLEGATGVINIGLAVLLIPAEGIWGAAIANLASVLCLYVWVPGLHVRRRFGLNWPACDMAYLFISAPSMILLIMGPHILWPLTLHD